jgi:nicotinamidase-related amidase
MIEWMRKRRRKIKGGYMSTALVLIDIQRDYFPGGRMEVVGAVEACGASRSLLNHFREKGMPIIHVRHVSTRPDATFFLPDTEGTAIHEDVAPLPHEVVITKHFPNSFRDTGLKQHLASARIDELVFCGMMSHMCIDATVRAAFDDGYACIVAHDACAARNLEFQDERIPAAHVHGAFMAALGAVFARVMSAGEIIAIPHVST